MQFFHDRNVEILKWWFSSKTIGRIHRKNVSDMYSLSLHSRKCLFQIVLRHSEHPPIMNETSWTLAAPFKEKKFHRTPSESIANNYTPSASHLKLRDLAKKRKIPSGTNQLDHWYPDVFIPLSFRRFFRSLFFVRHNCPRRRDHSMADQ